MADIVKRLRAEAPTCLGIAACAEASVGALLYEAANDIERLRAALRSAILLIEDIHEGTRTDLTPLHQAAIDSAFETSLERTPDE